MFKKRGAPAGGNKRKKEEEPEEKEEGSDDEATADKLAELRAIQKEMWGKSRGVPPAPEQMKEEKQEEEEEEEQWGLLENKFGGSSGQKGPDTHLEAYLNERLYDKKEEEERIREKSREDKLFEVPAELQVPDFTEQAADKMSWVAGLAEVALPVEYKLKNIEATEKAKREYLYGQGGRSKTDAVIEPDAVTRKAFGSRFMHFNENNSKSASDDAAVDRFRKRMRT
eukprot:TRINITY_DN29237_c2_g2_i1.p1 TRINITY_DN29237_c2_g2~~TRINITY_DN29237_c2_g2_i1.p1  ORF type:complete len:226 (-),score=73.60 TRINITY_DN29237_c2_g2_i1:157-834(-)